MKKVAIFTEGHCELIFLRKLILNVFNYQNISLTCLEVVGDKQRQFPYKYEDPNYNINFELICVGNDTRVLSYIKDRYEGLIDLGFSMIIAIRDMYSKAYKKRVNHIDHSVIKSFIEGHQKTIKCFEKKGCHVQIHFSIMEFEAWLLSMPDLFPKIDQSLSIKNIKNQLGYDLTRISPEREFFHPTKELDKILNLIGKKYNKSQDQIESLIAHLDLSDYQQAAIDDKCPSFRDLYSKFLVLNKKAI